MPIFFFVSLIFWSLNRSKNYSAGDRNYN